MWGHDDLVDADAASSIDLRPRVGSGPGAFEFWFRGAHVFGLFLYAITISVLAAWAFPRQSGPIRLAAAVLVALGVPITVLSVAAGLGLDLSWPGVVVVHAMLWAIAVSRRGRRETGRVDSTGVLSSVFLAATVAFLSALIGPDPSGYVIIDAWAHLAWSRDLAVDPELYARGFPAFLSTLTPFDPLFGAFRASAILLHFALATQFLALARRPSSRVVAALAALAYLLAPAVDFRAEIPLPEFLSAIFIVAIWWVVRSETFVGGWRAVTLALLAAVVVFTHVSALQIATFTGIGVALLLGAGRTPWPGRILDVAGLVLGVVFAALLSPSLMVLVTDPGSLPLLNLQSGSVDAAGPRVIVRGMGLSLCGLLALGAARVIRNRRRVEASDAAQAAGLGVTTLLLFAPIALAHADVELPLQVFTLRLVHAACLSCAVLVVVGFDTRREEGPLSPAWLALTAVVFVVGQLPIDRVGFTMIAVAAVVLFAAIATYLRVSGPAWFGFAAVALIASVSLRAAIWVPEQAPSIRWLREAPEALPIVTNWPATNELDALVDVPVLDGLAGRDAQLGLHRGSFTTDLRDRLWWCGGESALGPLARYLEDSGLGAVHVVVDARFVRAWSVYAAARQDPNRNHEGEAALLYDAEPCPTGPDERLQRLQKVLREWPAARVVHESPEATVYRVESDAGTGRALGNSGTESGGQP